MPWSAPGTAALSATSRWRTSFLGGPPRPWRAITGAFSCALPPAWPLPCRPADSY